MSLLRLSFKSYITSSIKIIIIIMADRVARKDMGKRFRLSTEVRSTLQRQHDRWTPYRAYSRVEKELSVFRALCKMIISFFQMPAAATTENDDEVGCNGRAVKMFADLIKRSFRDEDFLARKCTTFNVVLFLLSYWLSFNGTICK